MQVEVGAVVEGTVTGITKFGAFVRLPDGRSGLVHISEIANTYVNDVNEFLKLGDKVKVRVLAITPDGKINLSIKKAEPAPERPNNRPMNGGRPGGNRPNNGTPRAPRQNRSAQRRGRSAARAGTLRLKTGLKQFMQESDSRMAGNRLYSDHARPPPRQRPRLSAQTAYPSSKSCGQQAAAFFSCSADAQRPQISYPNKKQNRPPARTVGLRLPSAAHADAGPAAMEALAERQAYIHNEILSRLFARNSAEKKSLEI